MKVAVVVVVLVNIIIGACLGLVMMVMVIVVTTKVMVIILVVVGVMMINIALSWLIGAAMKLLLLDTQINWVFLKLRMMRLIMLLEEEEVQ